MLHCCVQLLSLRRVGLMGPLVALQRLGHVSLQHKPVVMRCSRAHGKPQRIGADERYQTMQLQRSPECAEVLRPHVPPLLMQPPRPMPAPRAASTVRHRSVPRANVMRYIRHGKRPSTGLDSCWQAVQREWSTSVCCGAASASAASGTTAASLCWSRSSGCAASFCGTSLRSALRRPQIVHPSQDTSETQRGGRGVGGRATCSTSGAAHRLQQPVDSADAGQYRLRWGSHQRHPTDAQV